MPIFKSDIPDVEIPTDLTVWQWLYESKYSSIRKYPESKLGGFLYQPTKARLNWRQVRDHATHLSTALVRRHGLGAGETVALFSRNSIWYPVMLQAASRIGAIVSGASPAYGVEEMVHALKSGNSKYLVTIPSSMEIASRAAEQAGISRDRIFLLEGNLDGYATLQDLIAVGRSYGPEGQTPAYQIPKGKHSHDICGFLSFSSGTTGLPKAVMISHYNMIAQCQQMEPVYEPTHRKVLAVLPFFHITGLSHVMHLPIFLNMEVIILPAFSMPDMLQAIQEHRIRELLLVPPIYIRLVHDPIVDEYDMSSVRWFGSGSAPLSPEVVGQLEKKFPGTGLKQGWGMTESTACITIHPPEIATYRYAHTVGKVVPNTEVRIVRSDGSDAGAGEPGEILARGPQVTMGYLGRPDATAETFVRGDGGDGGGGGVWLHTGDQGRINADGTVQITDRIKELIKVNGIGVAPAELEDALLGHPRVQDAAVIGIADGRAGERPKAFVVAKGNGRVGASDLSKLGTDILRHVREAKVRHKWLAEVEFVDAVPKSPTGKILRKVLRARQKDGRQPGAVVVRASGGADERAPAAKL